jgi:hypothetical protein
VLRKSNANAPKPAPPIKPATAPLRLPIDDFKRSIDFDTDENAFFVLSRPKISTVVLGTFFL